MKAYLVFFFFWAGLSGPLHAMTLPEAFAAAKKNTGTLTGKQLDIDIAENRKKQGVGSLLPSVEVSSVNLFRDDAGASNVSSSFTETHQHTARISLTQPLFRGGSTYYGLKIARNLPKIARLDLRQTEIELYETVAQAFYEVLQYKSDIDHLREQTRLLQERISDIRQRTAIGRSKNTELLSAQSILARTESELASGRSQMILAQQRLAALIGIDSVTALQDDGEVQPAAVPPDWADRLMAAPQVAANELILEQARLEVGVARGSYLPSLELNGDYFLDRGGVLADSKWEVTVDATWEIYSGGRNTAEKNIQQLEARKLEYYLTDLKRNLRSRFEAQKLDFQARQEELGKLKQAVQLAEVSYREHRREFSSGLVSNLEVLNSLDELLQARRALGRKVYETKLSWIRLQATVGATP